MIKGLIIAYFLGMFTGVMGVFCIRWFIRLRRKLRRLAEFEKRMENKQYHKDLMDTANYRSDSIHA